MVASHALSTDETLDVYIQPGWNGNASPRFVDMGDGIIASCMIMERRILDRETGEDATKALLVGRRFVAFRIDADCEVVEIGPPAICPGDTNYYYDDTYTHDVGDDGSNYFDGTEGIRDESAIIKMNETTVVGLAINGLNAVFVNGGDDVEDRYDSTEMVNQCIGWVARLNKADLTWTVGPKATIQHHYYKNANDLYQGYAGVGNETDPMGAVAMTNSLAVVSLAMMEEALGDEHLDWDGDGDYTDQGINRELDSSTYPIGQAVIGYLKLSALSVDTSALTMSVINSVRVTDRMTNGDWFARTDQPHRLSDARGAIVFSRPSEKGFATVWRHDGTGAISGFTTSQWADDEVFEFENVTVTTEAEAAAFEESFREHLQNLRTNWDDVAHEGCYFPTSAKLSDTLIAVAGSETYFYNKFLHILRVNGDDTVTVLDYKPLHGSDDASCQIVPVGTEGWVWVSFEDNTPQALSDEEQEGYTRQGAYLIPSGMSMALFHVDLTSGQIDDYVPLGTGTSHTSYKDNDFLDLIPAYYSHRFWLGGRGIVGTTSSYRSFPYGADHVIIGNNNTLTLISPLAQTFPITQMEQNPFTGPNLTLANWDLWYVDQTAYEPDTTIVDQIEHDRRVQSYPGREP